MTTPATAQPKTSSRRTLLAAIAAALAASICCVGPLVLIALGASGAWMSGLTVLEPVRPLLILSTGGFLGYAAARVYGKSSEPEVCVPGTPCANPRTDRVTKLALWGVSALVASLLMVPTLVGLADQGENDLPPTETTTTALGVAQPATNQQARERVVLSVENMTCAACPHNVRKALAALDGVEVLEITLDPPRAVVEYDPATTALAELTTATANVGYPSTVNAS